MTLPTKNKSKFRTMYGLTLQELANKHNRSKQAIYELHKRGRLRLFLSDPEKFDLQRYLKNDTKYLTKYSMTCTKLAEFLGLRNHCTLYDLDKAGLLHCCVDKVKQTKLK